MLRSKLMGASSEVEFAEAVVSFKAAVHPSIFKYIEKEWLSCKEKWAQPWRFQVFCLGKETTQMAESNFFVSANVGGSDACALLLTIGLLFTFLRICGNFIYFR